MADEERIDPEVERLIDYASFANSIIGKKILQYLRESLDGNTFVENSKRSAYLQGRRSVYLDIIWAVEQGQLHIENLDLKAQTTAETRGPAELPATLEEL